MHPNNICTCSQERERFIQFISDIKVGDTIQQEYWTRGKCQHKWAKVLAVGTIKIFVRHEDGSECAWTFSKRRWVRYVPREILCYNSSTQRTMFCKENEVGILGHVVLKTESGELIVKE